MSKKIINPEISCSCCGITETEIYKLNNIYNTENELLTVTIRKKTEKMCFHCLIELQSKIAEYLLSGNYSVPRTTAKFRDYVLEEIRTYRTSVANRERLKLKFGDYMLPLIKKYCKATGKIEIIDLCSTIRTKIIKWNDEYPSHIIQMSMRRTDDNVNYSLTFEYVNDNLTQQIIVPNFDYKE